MSRLQEEGTQSTGFTTTQYGTKSHEKFQRSSGRWSKKQEPQKSGSDREVLLNFFSEEISGKVAMSFGEAQELVHASRRLQGPRRH